MTDKEKRRCSNAPELPDLAIWRIIREVKKIAKRYCIVGDPLRPTAVHLRAENGILLLFVTAIKMKVTRFEQLRFR